MPPDFDHAQPWTPRGPLDEHVVIDFPDLRVNPLTRPVERGIERLPLVAFEVLLRSPVIGLERGRVGAPLQVVPQLVGERLPRLVAPVEVAQASEGGERAVVEHDARLQVGSAAAPLERDALAQRIDVPAHGVRNALGAHLDRHRPLEIRCRHLLQQAVDEPAEVIQPHSRTTTPVRNAECGMRNVRVSVERHLAPRRRPIDSAFRTPHSAFRI